MATTKEMLKLLLPATSEEEFQRRREAIGKIPGAAWENVKAMPGAIGSALSRGASKAVEAGGDLFERAASGDVSAVLSLEKLFPGSKTGLEIGLQYINGTPEQRQAMLDMVASSTGATLGGIGGGLAGSGVLSIPAAAVGAAGGGATGLYASRLLGPVLGASGQLGSAEDFITEAGASAVMDAAFEGLPAAAAATKFAGKRVLNPLLRPKSDKQKAVNALIESTPELDEVMPLWSRTDSPGVGVTIGAMNSFPTSGGVMREADRRALDALQAQLEHVAAGKRTLPVGVDSRDALLDTTKGMVRQRTRDLQGAISQELDQIPNVDPTKAGGLVRQAHEEAIGSVSRLGGDAYSPVFEVYGDVPITLTPGARAIWPIVEEYNPQVAAMFRSGTTGPVNKAFRSMAPNIAEDGSAYPTVITMRQWHNLKSDVLDQLMSKPENIGQGARNLGAIKAALKESAEKSLPQDAWDAYGEAGKLYGEGIQNVRKPRGKYRNNPAVGSIIGPGDNEQVIKGISSPEDLFNVERATSQYGLTPGIPRIPGGGAAAPGGAGGAGGFGVDIPPQIEGGGRLAPGSSQRMLGSNLPGDVNYDKGFSADIPPQIEGNVSAPPPPPPPPPAGGGATPQRVPVPPPFGREVTRTPSEVMSDVRAAVARNKFLDAAEAGPLASGEYLSHSPSRLLGKIGASRNSRELARETGYGDPLARIAKTADQENLLTRGLYGERIFDPGFDAGKLPDSMAQTPGEYGRARDLLGEQAPTLDRAYLENRVGEALGQDARLSASELHINPKTLVRQIRDPGTPKSRVMNEVLGDDYPVWENVVNAAEAVRAPERMFGNTSGTGTAMHYGMLAGQGAAAAGALYGGDNAGEKLAGLTAALGIPRAMAKLGANPRFARDVTSLTPPPFRMPSANPGVAAAARVPFRLDQGEREITDQGSTKNVVKSWARQNPEAAVAIKNGDQAALQALKEYLRQHQLQPQQP